MPGAGLDEIGDLLRRLGVDDPAKPRWLAARHSHHAAMICNHSDLNPANARVARDHFFGVVSLKLIEVTVVEQTFQQLSHVVRLSMIFRNDLVELFAGTQGFSRRLNQARRWLAWVTQPQTRESSRYTFDRRQLDNGRRLTVRCECVRRREFHCRWSVPSRL